MNVSRREFVAGVAGGALGIDPTEIRWKPGVFQAHFIYTGVGESVFLVFPDSTSMLLDCGDSPAIMRGEWAVPVHDPRTMGGEQVANYVRRVNPNGRKVDYLMVSHLHSDHVGTPNWQSCGPGMMKSREYVRSGFGIAAEQLTFSTAIDRGYPAYDEPVPMIDGWDRELWHMKALYAYLQKRDGLVVERFRLGADDQIVSRHGGAKGFRVFNLCANGKVAMPDGSVVDALAGLISPDTKKVNENVLSLGNVFSYGAFRMFSAGDFSDGCDFAAGTGGCEDVLARACPPVEVAKINHHGHHAMPRSLVAALQARCWIANVWDQKHITDDTMQSLADRSAYPGDRTVFPGVLTRERQEQDAGRAWLADVERACFDTGVHVVVTVPEGGETYSVACVDASVAEGRVKSVRTYKTRGLGA